MTYQDYLSELPNFFDIAGQEKIIRSYYQNPYVGVRSNSRIWRSIKGIKNSEAGAQDLSFQLDNRFRARLVLYRIQSLWKKDLKGLTILDVGCGHGGLVAEALSLGMNAIGVDVSARHLKLAKANTLNEGSCRLFRADASCPSIVDVVGAGSVDLIVLNDVLEHVYDTPQLIENMSKLLKEGGALYYAVPNGFSTRYVMSEGHKKVFGVTLVDPDCWHYFIKGRPSIFYRRWQYFRAIFELNYFDMVCVNNKSPLFWNIRKRILSDLAKIKEQAASMSYSLAQTNVMEPALLKYEQEMLADIKVYSNNELFFKYMTNFWKGLLIKKTSHSQNQKSLREAKPFWKKLFFRFYGLFY